MKIFSKIPSTGESIFAVMTAMANKYGAINLSQGFPDFNCSDELINLVHKFQLKGFNQYAPMPGILPLRESISNKIEKIYSAQYDPVSEITITAGATQAIFTAVTAFINKGDEVIIFEPAYDSYLPSIVINGGVPIPISLNTKNFSIDWDEVKKLISSKTKMIILNSPQNPAGSLLSENDIQELGAIVNKYDLIIISDEVYEHIIFDDAIHYSLCNYNELKNNVIAIFSFGKTYHTTGWKIGYVVAAQNLTSEFRKVHQFNVFSCNTPVQHAYSEFMKDEKLYLELGNFYQKKRDFFIDKMKNSRFIFTPSKGTYFQLLDYSSISSKNDFEFSEYLAKEIGVAVIPLSPFYKNGSSSKLIRICFAKSEAVLESAAEKLGKM